MTKMTWVSMFVTGDDVVGVKWMDMDHSLQLYASHAQFVRTVAQNHQAHW